MKNNNTTVNMPPSDLSKIKSAPNPRSVSDLQRVRAEKEKDRSTRSILAKAKEITW